MLNSIRNLYGLLSARERIQTIVLLLLMMFGALLETVGVGAIPAFVALLSQPAELLRASWASGWLRTVGVTTEADLVTWGGIALFVLFILKNAYVSTLLYLQSKFVFQRFNSLSIRIVDRYLSAPYAFHLQRNSAELLRNATQETTSMVHDVFMPALLLVSEVLVVLCVSALLVAMEPVLSLLAFAVLGTTSFVFAKAVRARTSSLGKIQQEERRWMIQSVNEALGGIKDAKVLNREPYFLMAFRRSILEYSRTARFSKLVQQLPRPVFEATAVAGLLLVGFVFVVQGRPLTAMVSTLALFGSAILRLLPSAQRIMASATCIRFNHRSLDVVATELSAARPASEGSQESSVASRAEVEPLRFEQSVELKQVTYRYPGQEQPSLRGVFLTIRKNEMVGIVGASGAGKSTLVDVLLGLLEPEHGALYVDGAEIRHGDAMRRWQRAIGYIPQTIFLSDSTIARNVAFGIADDRRDEAAVWDALEAAQLADFVRALPDGLHTKIGERGVRLSGGQRQRIGIARALYHRPSVLVMDEATSALDTRTENDFIQAVERLRAGATVVIVAHRMSTVRSCDRLYVFDRGQIVDSGTFDALLLDSGHFRNVALAAQD